MPSPDYQAQAEAINRRVNALSEWRWVLDRQPDHWYQSYLGSMVVSLGGAEVRHVSIGTRLESEDRWEGRIVVFTDTLRLDATAKSLPDPGDFATSIIARGRRPLRTLTVKTNAQPFHQRSEWPGRLNVQLGYDDGELTLPFGLSRDPEESESLAALLPSLAEDLASG